MISSIPIVVAVYNRPDCLQRLLVSLDRAHYPDHVEVPLILSLEGGADEACERLAEDFEWRVGPKRIIRQQNHLGLRQHIMACAAQSKASGAALILEDDLILSPYFYQFARETTLRYQTERKVASIGLYSYRINEFCHYPFEPIPDQWDAFFMQVPCSWGQVFLGHAWQDFENFLQREGEAVDGIKLPDTVKRCWRSHSWKKLFFKFLVCEDRFVVYPRQSFSDHRGELGTHFKKPCPYFATSLSMNPGPYQFPQFHETWNIYDAFLEVDMRHGMWDSSVFKDAEMDLYGLKPLELISCERVVTSRKVRGKFQTLELTEQPLQQNLLNPADSNVEHTQKEGAPFLSIAPLCDVMSASPNTTLNTFFAERISPPLRTHLVNIGIALQLDYLLKNPIFRGLWMIKRVLLRFRFWKWKKRFRPEIQ